MITPRPPLARAVLLDGKRPVQRGWLHRDLTESEVRAHRGNFGCRTGEPRGTSDVLWVLDVDCLDNLKALERVNGGLPGWRVRSGGGGEHIHLSGEPGYRSCSIATPDGGRVELKANGSQVVWPGAIHPSGRRYVPLTERPATLPDAPAWLVELASRSGAAYTGGGATSSRDFASEPVSAVVYVPVLVGSGAPNRASKVRCPFHDDERPSLHVYDQERDGRVGWYCFSCGVGGRAWQLLALTLGLVDVAQGPVRLDSFTRNGLKERLRALFPNAPEHDGASW